MANSSFEERSCTLPLVIYLFNPWVILVHLSECHAVLLLCYYLLFLLYFFTVCSITSFTATSISGTTSPESPIKKEFQWKNIPNFSTTNTDAKKSFGFSVVALTSFKDCFIAKLLSEFTDSLANSYTSSVWKNDLVLVLILFAMFFSTLLWDVLICILPLIC